MKHLNLIAGLGLALAMATGGARAEHPPSVMIEGAVESYTNLISLPSSATGEIAVRDCEACAGHPLRLSAATQFYIGSRLATLQEMNLYLRSGKRFPAVIFYNLGDGLVSRVAAGR
jgi:hypothetical protein